MLVLLLDPEAATRFNTADESAPATRVSRQSLQDFVQDPEAANRLDTADESGLTSALCIVDDTHRSLLFRFMR